MSEDKHDSVTLLSICYTCAKLRDTPLDNCARAQELMEFCAHYQVKVLLHECTEYEETK